MLSTVLLILGVGLLVQGIRVYRRFMRLLSQAKSSGIPYKIVPVYVNNKIHQLSLIFLEPIFEWVPKRLKEPWFTLTTLEWSWTRRCEPFKTFGTDTFLTVSPERIMLYTADADVVAQITNRSNDFPKALEVYGILQIYGPNVVCLEGQRFRHHRKITSPPFSEKNNHLVWRESIFQAQAMVKSWLGAGKKESPTIKTVADDAMRLSLHIISRAGFGVHLDWPGQNTDNAAHAEKLENGHTMSYTDALQTLLHLILFVLALPTFLQKTLPFETTKRARRAYLEWGQYMKEMFHEKKAAVLAGTQGDEMDLMVAMVKGAGVTDDPKTQTLSDSEILGNAFFFILAGHETTANSIHFSLVYLALNIASQRRLQRDLDETFQGKSPQDWNYERDAPKLFENMAGAVMNEELRLAAPVTGIPKSTPPTSPQPIMINGKRCIIPENTYISILTPSSHRNPNQWPTGPPKDPNKPSHPFSNHDNDLEEFKPERWILDSEEKRAAAQRILSKFSDEDVDAKDADASGLGLNSTVETASTFYKPPKGAFVPFSDGHRSCLGKRFAQVELLAVLSVIFTKYSVELALDQWADDAELESMNEQGRRDIWNKARDQIAKQLVHDTASVVTLQLRKGHIPLRLVERGSERFNFE